MINKILISITTIIILLISCGMTIYLKNPYYLWLNGISFFIALIIDEIK